MRDIIIQDPKVREWLLEEKMKITHPEMIVPWFLKNQGRIIYESNRAVGDTMWGKYKRDDQYTHLSLELRNKHKPEGYVQNVSNTHRCPDNGVTNFSWNADRPRGYPGWAGTMHGKLHRAKRNLHEYPYSLGLNLVGLKTGSGGGGNESWTYDVSIFLDDWPGLKPLAEQLELDALHAKLMGQ